MISKERLEELIRQGETIYGIEFNKVEIYDLSDKDITISPINFGEHGLRVYNALGYWNDIEFHNLFETKKEAEFYKNYKNIQSLHILDLPTWQELQKTACFYFKDYYGEDCIMRDDVDEINVEGTIDNEPYRRELATWTFPRTEDGYLSACEICKKLFLGTVDEK